MTELPARPLIAGDMICKTTDRWPGNSPLFLVTNVQVNPAMVHISGTYFYVATYLTDSGVLEHVFVYRIGWPTGWTGIGRDGVLFRIDV